MDKIQYGVCIREGNLHRQRKVLPFGPLFSSDPNAVISKIYVLYINVPTQHILIGSLQSIAVQTDVWRFRFVKICALR